MNVKNSSKRVLSLVLVLCMLAGLVPWSVVALAADGTTEHLFFASDRHANTSIIGTLIDNMESDIGEDELEYLGLCGDMDGSGDNHPTYKSSTVLSEVTGATTSLDATNVDIVAGIHDMNVNDDAGIVLGYTDGGKQICEGEHYYIYGVPEYCISEPDSTDGTGSTADEKDAYCKAQAAAFETWAANVADKSKVIIVMSHYPLHQRRSDNDYANYWADALNNVAVGDDTTIDRDVVFFWGHNHTGESDADTNVYHVAPGKSISVQGGSSSQTIYFTYANAGYLKEKSSATLMTITDTEVKFEKYVSSSVSTTNTVTRVVQETKTPVSIEVTGYTHYTVGGNGLSLAVTATYDDGTTEVVTDDCTFTGVDLSKSGKYTVTATYGDTDITDTIDVTVAVYGECVFEATGAVDAVTEVISEGVTGVEIENVYGEPDLSDTFTDYVSYNITLENYTEGNEIEYTLSLADDMDTTNLYLYHVAVVDGETVLTPVDFTVENGLVLFTTALTGTFAYGAITVPDGYELYSIAVSNYTKDYFVGENLLITEPFTVTATYKKTGSDDFLRVISVYEENNNPDGYTYNRESFDMSEAGTYNVEVNYTYGGISCSTTFPINVWDKSFTKSDVTVTVGGYGVNTMSVTDVSDAENVNAAVGLLLNAGFKAFDIVPAIAESYELKGEHTVKMPAPANADVVYYFNETTGGLEKIEDAKFADGYVTFTTDHFSIYVVGDLSEAESQSVTVEATTTTETDDVWVKVDAPTDGEEYLIVSTGTAGTSGYIQGNQGNSTAVTPVSGTLTVNGTAGTYTYIESTDTGWIASGSGSSWTFANGSNYLGYTQSSSGNFLSGTTYSYTVNTAASATTWTLNNNQMYINLQASASGIFGGSDSNADFYLTGGSSWSMSTTASNVYFYQRVSVTTESTGDVTYTLTANDIEHIYSTIKQDDGTYIFDTSVTADIVATTNATGGSYSYAIVNDVNGIIDTEKSGDGTLYFTGKTGEAMVRVYYTFKVDDKEYKIWDTITVKASAPYYSIQLHKAEMTVATGVTADNVTDYYVFNSTTGTYEKATSYVEGTTYYTDEIIPGEEITDIIALKGVEAGDTYSVWAVVLEHNANGETDLGTLNNALSWVVSDESIAKIDTKTGLITFTGKSYGSFNVTVSYVGADGKTITDTITISATKSLYVVPEDGTDDFPEYPDEGAVRFDKTATAVGNYSETGIAKVELSMTGVPYTTGSAIDALLVLDMSTSMKTEVEDGVTRYDVTAAATKKFIETIVKNSDGTYNNNTVCVHYFNGNTAYTDAITSGFITISSDEELDAVYAKIDALVADPPSTSGTDYSVSMEAAYNAITERDKVSDNTQALVFMSDGGPTYYTYVNGDSSGTVSNNAGTIVGWFDTDNNDTTNDETDDTATPNSSFRNEYYSTLLKEKEYPIYTVGLGLSSNDTGPSAFTGLTSGAHEAVTSYILSQMATDANHFYNIADDDAVANMGNIFSGIAESIKEAAKDVVVEDKIGNKYSMNFGLPGYGTGNALDETALDGLENFYIQVVEYTLDATTHERTDTYTVKENFTFNLNGTLASHTVDGVECSDCTHVETDGSTITAINGTYFTYTSGDDGEILTWTADKLTGQELALQYFAHLDNSSGVSKEEQIKAGTYYTNEYATLTYTNVNDKQVQQEFPVPQMTWYGAQVSYVFYLVNEQGQPVNKAGRVVPFAEAVYVTEVYKKEVIWNSLEQSSSLEASYLAGEVVPDIYDLYDDNASYSIHVYADEKGMNLNNHFLIGGTTGTTYVFNTKADGTKYYNAGAYIADSDGTYLCKGAGTVSNVTWVEVTLSSDSDLVNAAYYYDKDGVKTRLTAEVYAEHVEIAANGGEAVTYYKLGSASYTPVDGETQWVPGENDSTTGGTVLNYGYVYYVDANGDVYTIVQKTNGTQVRDGFDFANTTVAFAVVWKPELQEDTVVVDFGLDVVVDVIHNDVMAAGVVGVMLSAPDAEINSGMYAVDSAVGLQSISNEYWTVTVENLNCIRFKQNKMGISTPVTFYYEVKVNHYDSNGVLQTDMMYSSVTVIPATTVYYEESFVSFEHSSAATDDSTIGKWETVGTALNKTQAQDRPDDIKVPSIDANNVYGYDSAYADCTEFSNGGAMKVTVDKTTAYKMADAPYATFTFTGTGFDVISRTDFDSGLILVTVKDASDNTVATKSVDNYYGCIYGPLYDKNGNPIYKTDADGNYVTDANGDKIQKEGWIINPDADVVEKYPNNTIWQVPVIKIDGLTYGEYTAEIKVLYMNALDHQADGSYSFWLDAIRIYDPVSTSVAVGNVTVGDIYALDNEANADYVTVKDIVLSGDNIVNGKINGAVFIDGKVETKIPEDYNNPGPNNETYLAHEQSVAFKLVADKEPKAVQIGAKLAYGTGATLALYSLNADSKGDEITLKTATDMFYSLDLQWKAEGNQYVADVILANATEGAVISITELKLVGAEYVTTTSAASYARTAVLTQTEDEIAHVSAVSDAEFVEDAKILLLKEFSADEIYEVGDINGDGVINAIDTNLMSRILAGVKTPTLVETIAADINEKGDINAIDSYKLKKIIAGKN